MAQYDEKELMDTVKIAALDNVLTADIFRVVAFYPETQTVDLEPCVKVWDEDIEGVVKVNKYGEYKYMSATTNGLYLLNVPVQQIKCGQFSITIPVAVGDCGIVHFLKNDIQNWKVSGGQTEALYVSPFDVSSCVYSGFVPNETTKDGNFNANSLEIKSKSAIITVSEDSVSITTASSVSVDASSINLNGDTTITGSLTVSSDVTASGTVTGSDCMAGAISLMTHIHSGGTGPEGKTGTPE